MFQIFLDFLVFFSKALLKILKFLYKFCILYDISNVSGQLIIKFLLLLMIHLNPLQKCLLGTLKTLLKGNTHLHL